MELKIEKILSSVIKKSSLVIFLISILLLFIIGFLYWRYLYTPLNIEPEADIEDIENKINRSKLNKLIKNINRKEERYRNSLKRKYSNPF